MSLFSAFLSLPLILLLTSAFLYHIHAQTPLATQGASFASVEGQFFLISGGSLNDTTRSIPQTFKIDLSVTWKASNPAITVLQNGPAEDFVPTTLMPDNQTFVLFTSQQPYTFDMLSGWSPKASITNMTAVSGRTYWNAAAVDPSTRKVYVPNGITQKEAGNDVRYMLEYDVASGASKPISQSGAGNLGDLQDYVVVWSTSLNKLLAYGGRSNATTFNLNLYAYTPSADQWQILETVGNNPGGRGYFCMIPAYGGSKFVVFGGFGPNPTLADHSDVFVLDVSNPATLAWTKLADDQGNNYRRGSSACAVDHDLFIAWGGGTNGVPVTKNTTMVFNLTSNQWITEFKPSAVPVKSEPKNLAAIAGGSVGGVALVAVAVTSWIVYRQRSRTRFTQPEDQFKDAAGQDILLGQQPQRHQDQGHVQHSGRADDYESSAMSTVDETPGSKQSPLRGPQSLGWPGPHGNHDTRHVVWERHTRPQDPQTLEHAQRFGT